MKTVPYILLLFISLHFHLPVAGQDSLSFQGQASAWMNINTGNVLPFWSGARYIPQGDLQFRLPGNRSIDFEASINLTGSIAMKPFDTAASEASLKPYRFWVRYSTRQFELRLGLQKINFGSATMLRPLMWFDQLDPRDPLQMTNGVWALLGRYYFLNNANIWFWCLYGNKDLKTWETGTTSKGRPELGGRVQLPLNKGEAGISYHFRQADTRELPGSQSGDSLVPEHRLGLDGKWDLGVGLWFEGSWIHKAVNSGIFTNQEIMTVGTDYTFALGNGLNLVFEQMIYGYGEKAFDLGGSLSFSGISSSYPVNLNNQVSVIFYHDWLHKTQYNFMNWKHQFKKIDFYIMAFWNPGLYQLPQQSGNQSTFAGKGVQFMLVYNH